VSFADLSAVEGAKDKGVYSGFSVIYRINNPNELNHLFQVDFTQPA